MSWFKKQPPTTPAPPPPAAPATEPGNFEAVSGNIGFANGERSWTEKFDVVDSLASVLQRRGYLFDRDSNTIQLTASEFVIAPLLVSFAPLDNGGAQITTVTRLRHPSLVPDGLFEY